MTSASDPDARSPRDRPARQFVTAEDVARLAGVSRSAVSRTFTPGASVSDEVRLRVQVAAKELGYRVNRLARSLISDELNLVGVVGANLALPFMAQQLDELSRALLNRGLQCLLLNAAEAEAGIAPLIELILEFRVRAIVVLSGSPPAAIVDECIATGVRVVMVNRQVDNRDADTIVSDDGGGARLAARHLIEAGCRRFGVVASGARTPAQVRRQEGFVESLGDSGFSSIVWGSGETTYETGVRAARELLSSHDLDGVFCVTDLLALGFVDGARAAGRRVPDDLSVIGFDDILQSSWAPYRLTTIRQSMEHLTASIVEAIERLGPARRGLPVHHVVPVELVERDTVRPRL